MSGGDLTEVARRHAPALVFHPDEKYPPLDPEVFIAGAELRWRDSTTDVHIAGGVLGPTDSAQLGQESGLRSPDGDAFRPTDFTRPYDARKGQIDLFPGFRASSLAAGFYLHYVGDRDRLEFEGGTMAKHLVSGPKCFFEVDDERSPSRITYWYFFRASTLLDKPVERALAQEIAAASEGDAAQVEAELLGRFVELHEGDWEGVTVQLGEETQVLLHQHGELVPALSRPGKKLRIYIARGSHAATDGAPSSKGEAVGEGARWDLGVTNLCNARRQPWYGFGGAWGAVDRDIPNIPDPIADRLIRSQRRDPQADTTGPLGPSVFKATFEVDKRRRATVN